MQIGAPRRKHLLVPQYVRGGSIARDFGASGEETGEPGRWDGWVGIIKMSSATGYGSRLSYARTSPPPFTSRHQHGPPQLILNLSGEGSDARDRPTRRYFEGGRRRQLDHDHTSRDQLRREAGGWHEAATLPAGFDSSVYSMDGERTTLG
ncbi:hypothetical protein OF83DRAFT_222169 [Amylostereum chailletii]|nr:hypothetical protein OF83DRAFT_222169 [Amylostereum chailletii]